MIRLLAAATLIAFTPTAWAQSTKHAAGRTRAAAAQNAPKKAAVRKPAIVKIRCKSADFEFGPGGDTADVVDRDFGDAVVTTVAELRASPKTYVIAWERSMGTILGPRVLRYRYLINRETGQAQVQSIDETPGMSPMSLSREEQCAIE